jgi:YD repeat-containing protein
VRVREPSGGERQIRYDYFGTPVACVDEHGAETRFLWDAAHRLTSLRYADGSSVDFEYDALGRLTALRSARGQRFELRWSGFDAVVEVRRPNGTRVAFRYDREGELVRVVDENDEEHVIVRDGVGHVIRETTYDGLTLRYRVDKLGNLTRVRRASGRFVDFEYDALGRMVSRSFGDELVETFAYDPLGRLVRAAGAGIVAELEYDLRGRLTRETVRAGAETTTLEAVHDELDNRIEARTSWGHGERVAYDRMGDPTELGLSAAPSALAAGARADVSFRRGVNGREIERRLDGRATLQQEYDLMGRFSTRRIVGGGASGATLWEQSFVFDADGSLLRTNDPIGRTVELAYDPVGQLVSRIPERARAELYSYDPAGALQDGRPRRYEPGSRQGGRRRRAGHADPTRSEGPASCAEPQAVSDYPYRRGLGNNASDEEIAAALRDM